MLMQGWDLNLLYSVFVNLSGNTWADCSSTCCSRFCWWAGREPACPNSSSTTCSTCTYQWSKCKPAGSFSTGIHYISGFLITSLNLVMNLSDDFVIYSPGSRAFQIWVQMPVQVPWISCATVNRYQWCFTCLPVYCLFVMFSGIHISAFYFSSKHCVLWCKQIPKFCRCPLCSVYILTFIET